MKAIKLFTDDNYPLQAHVFEPEISNQKLLLINTATGVKQQVYFSFAKFMSEQGFTVVTYDYRGVGLSKPPNLKGFDANMRIWGSLDYKALTDFVKQNFKHYKFYVLGHSVGALILGMNKASLDVEKFIFIATQNTYKAYLSFRTRWFVNLGFGFIQPALSKSLGYFPANWFGLGESIPKGSSEDWRTLLMHKKSVKKLLESTDDYSTEMTQDVLFLKIEDDWMITDKGMQSLREEVYKNMNFRTRKVMVSESNGDAIGHINFFRSKHKKLWNIILDYLK